MGEGTESQRSARSVRVASAENLSQGGFQKGDQGKGRPEKMQRRTMFVKEKGKGPEPKPTSNLGRWGDTKKNRIRHGQENG